MSEASEYLQAYLNAMTFPSAVSCEPGHEGFWNDLTNQFECRPCRDGYWKDNEMVRSTDDCALCPEEFVTNKTGAIHPSDCNVGKKIVWQY